MILMELSLVDLTVTRRARCDDSQCFLEVTYHRHYGILGFIIKIRPYKCSLIFSILSKLAWSSNRERHSLHPGIFNLHRVKLIVYLERPLPFKSPIKSGQYG